jgi:hypothetical protein
MKPLLILLLLFVFAYLQMGYYFHSLSKRQEAKSEFEQKLKATIRDSNCTSFDLASIKDKISLEEEGKEFWLNGELYDIVSMKVINGKTYLLCLSDAKEEAIADEQLRLTVSNANNASSKKSGVARFSLPDIILTEAPTSGAACKSLAKKFPGFAVDPINHFVEPHFLPPQSA